MTYDANDGYVVIYGDVFDTLNFSQSTWVFQNDSWQVLPTNGSPPGLAAPSLAYFSASKEIVLFGGANYSAFYSGGAYLNETWVLKHGNWTRLNLAREPPARMDAGMVDDVSDGYLLLYGGIAPGPGGYTVLNDTWEFSNGNWTLLNSSPHPPFFFSGDLNGNLVYDSTDGYVILVTNNDTWKFHNATWTLVNNSGMPPGHGSTNLVDDSAGHRVLMLGGCCNSTTNLPYSDLWAYSGGNWTIVARNGTPAPAIWFSPAAVYDNASGEVVFFAGSCLLIGGASPDASTWVYSTGMWSPVNATTNAYHRYAGGLVYDPTERDDVLFGGRTYGFTSPTTYNGNDTWTYRNGTWSIENITGAPGGRQAPAMTYDYADGYVLLFGGWNYPGGAWPDTWRYTNHSWSPIQTVSHPVKRWGAAMTYDATDGYVLLFGGVGTASIGLYYYSDTWIFSNGSWTNITANVTGMPPVRAGAAMTFDAATGYVLMFGGGYRHGEYNDTWEYRSDAWTNITATAGPAPSPRDSSVLEYLPSERCVVLSGGGNYFNGNGGGTYPGSSYGGTWIFFNGTWAKVPLLTQPQAAANAMGTYDPIIGAIVMYGGDGAPASTWLWSSAPALINSTLGVSRSPVEENGSVIFDANVRGGSGHLSFVWSGLPSGCSTVDSANLSCIPDRSGNYSITVRISDPVSGSNVTEGPVPLSVVKALVGEGLVANPTALDAGQNLTLKASVTGGMAPYSFNWTGLPSGCSGGSGDNITCSPGSAGEYSVKVKVTDSLGGSVVVGPCNFTVDASLSGSLTESRPAVDFGENVTFQGSRSGGLSPFTYTWQGLPSGCFSQDSLFLNCTPASVGWWNVTLRIADSTGAIQTLGPETFDVVPMIRISQVTASPPVLDVGMIMHINATVLGGVSPIRFHWGGDLPPGCSSTNGPELSCLATMAGNLTLELNATDETGVSAQAAVTIVVHPAPRLVSFSAVPSTLDVGQSTRLTAIIAGGDPGYIWDYTGLPAGCDTSDTPTIVCSPDLSGEATVEVTITDSLGLFTNQTLTIVVNPELWVTGLTSSPSSVTWGGSVTLTLGYTGGTGPVSVSYSGLWPGCLGGNLTRFTCATSTLGMFDVVAHLRDIVGENGSASTAVVVNPPALLITSFTASPAVVQLGNHTVLAVTFSGGFGSETVTYNGLPLGCASANNSQLTCAPTEVGDYSVRVTVTDVVGQNSSANLTLRVLPNSTLKQPGPSNSTGMSLPWAWIAVAIIAVVGASLAAVVFLRRRKGADTAEDSPTTSVDSSSESRAAEEASEEDREPAKP
jgi:hypothetical protein